MYDVLIMDDEAWARQIVKSLGKWDTLGLRIAGEADEGLLGLELAAELRPHIIITDMRMPGLGGDQLLQSLHERLPDTKILIMSGYEDFAYLKQAIQSQAVNYMLKPIDPEELNASLAQCVEQLNARRNESQGAWKALRMGPAVQDRYLAYRKLIYGHFMDLNERLMGEAFQQMAHYLDAALDDADARSGMSGKLAYDFFSLLEEFLVSEEVPLVQLVPDAEARRESIGRAPVREAVSETETLFREVLRSLRTHRQDRTRLDIDKVKEYVERYYDQPISLESVAKTFAVRKEYLSRAYKAWTGENISDAIMRIRMEKARELIVSHGLSIKRAAELTGYADITYFYRVFKKYFGMPPGNLRK